LDIGNWLRGLGLQQYEPAFHANEIDAEILPNLTAEDLTALGVTLIGHRRKLLGAIADLRARSVPPEEKLATTSSTAAQHDRPATFVPSEAERRQITVLFCDLVGSTALSSRLDPEDLRELMRAFQDTVARSVARYGGHMAKYLGDGVLVYFGWPTAYEDQAERAVRAGLDAVASLTKLEPTCGAPLQARVGIATGQVVIGDLIGEAGRDADAVTGETPNMAARLQQRAVPGEVLVSQMTRELIGPAFVVDKLDSLELKGFSEPVPAWRVSSVAPTGQNVAIEGRSLSRFVGRELELDLLLERWEQANGGQGRVVLLSAEPGMGDRKSVV